MTLMSQTRYPPGESVDFAIVGSGASGGVLARELATAGFSVVVFEQGPHRRAEDFSHDELGVLFKHELSSGSGGTGDGPAGR